MTKSTATSSDHLSEAELIALLDDDLLPKHLAIIMDGNGRWATSRGLPRVAGHGEGVKSVRSIVRAAGEVGIEYLTLYAFSSENWNRPRHEVSTLMSLLERSIDRELPELMARGVRFRVIGRPNGVPAEVQRRIDMSSRVTVHLVELRVRRVTAGYLSIVACNECRIVCVHRGPGTENV